VTAGESRDFLTMKLPTEEWVSIQTVPAALIRCVVDQTS
jgi:hypothetical protein